MFLRKSLIYVQPGNNKEKSKFELKKKLSHIRKKELKKTFFQTTKNETLKIKV